MFLVLIMLFRSFLLLAAIAVSVCNGACPTPGGCLPDTDDSVPVPSPSPTPFACPSAPPGGWPCSVCGEGSCVSKPNESFTIPSGFTITCRDFQQAGYNGEIPADSCSVSPVWLEIQGVCGCTKPLAPTSAPTKKPTPKPTPKPSVGRIRVPTRKPNTFSFPTINGN